MFMMKKIFLTTVSVLAITFVCASSSLWAPDDQSLLSSKQKRSKLRIQKPLRPLEVQRPLNLLQIPLARIQRVQNKNISHEDAQQEASMFGFLDATPKAILDATPTATVQHLISLQLQKQTPLPPSPRLQRMERAIEGKRSQKSARRSLQGNLPPPPVHVNKRHTI